MSPQDTSLQVGDFRQRIPIICFDTARIFSLLQTKHPPCVPFFADSHPVNDHDDSQDDEKGCAGRGNGDDGAEAQHSGKPKVDVTDSN